MAASENRFAPELNEERHSSARCSGGKVGPVISADEASAQLRGETEDQSLSGVS